MYMFNFLWYKSSIWYLNPNLCLRSHYLPLEKYDCNAMINVCLGYIQDTG